MFAVDDGIVEVDNWFRLFIVGSFREVVAASTMLSESLMLLQDCMLILINEFNPTLLAVEQTPRRNPLNGLSLMILSLIQSLPFSWHRPRMFRRWFASLRRV